jgi:DNA-binding transcriptional regulator of glucitol operon
VDGVWRVVLSPRWILWHLLAILAVAVCVVAAIWQWGRAGSALGSALNVGYGIQWPIFAVFFAYMWWRFLRLELLDHRANAATEGHEPAETAEPPAEPAVVAASTASPETRAPTPADHTDTPLPWDATPFTRSPLAAPTPVTDAEAPGLAEYNRMLAGLAARDAAPGAGRTAAPGRETADER